MSGAIRKALGPLKKRLSDRIKEIEVIFQDAEVIVPIHTLEELMFKITANIESHEKVYNKLYGITDLSQEEQEIVDAVIDEAVILEADANEILQKLKFKVDRGTLKDGIKSEVGDNKSNIEIEKLKVETETHRKKLELLSKTEVNTEVKTRHSDVKLPKLSLVTFSGDILEWPSFWDAFSSTIHNNNSVSNIDKFKYLLSALTDEAKDLLNGFSITESQYEPAVNLLKERFDDKEFIIHQHYSRLTTLKQCSNITSQLRKTINFVETQLRALTSMGENIENNYLVNLVKSKFPMEFNLKLEEGRSEIWKLSLLRTAINKLIIAREKSEFVRKEFHHENYMDEMPFTGEGLFTSQNGNRNNGSTNGGGKQFQAWCAFCDLKHWSDECQSFKTIEERKLQAKGRCFICLSKKHLFRQCLSQKACFYCKQKSNHHSALCPTRFGGESEHENNNNETIPTLITSSGCASSKINTLTTDYDVLMKTAKVYIVNTVTGKGKMAMALFDSGAKKSYITKDVAEVLGLVSGPANLVRLNTFGTTATSDIYTRKTCFNIQQLDGSSLKIVANICDNITGNIVRERVDLEKYKHTWKNLKLANNDIVRNTSMNADNKICNMKIDILIGNDFYDDIIGTERIQIKNGLYLINSTLGWIFSGRVENRRVEEDYALFVEESDGRMENSLWDLEAIGVTDDDGSNEKIMMENFSKSITKVKNRYQVSWLWKDSRYELPTNYGLSRTRLKSLVAGNDLDLLKRYDDTMKNYISRNIIEKAEVSKEYLSQSSVVVHYLPHHPVSKKDDPTKLRIVFEGNAKNHPSKKSLNECLFRGDNLVGNLCGMLLRFRLHLIGIIADIEQAYVQLALNPTDRDVVRFLWVKNINLPFSEDNIQEYRFCRVIWGIICAAFLLAYTIIHHLSLYHHDTITRTIERDLYVDNLVTGEVSTAEALKFYRKTKVIFNDASMNMRKWISNDKDVMCQIDEDDKCKDEVVKLLGMFWVVENDELCLAK